MRAPATAMLCGTLTIVALSFGCAGGGGPSGARLNGSGAGSTSAGVTSSGTTSSGTTSSGTTSSGTTSSGTTTSGTTTAGGPQVGAPTSPMVYTLCSADGGTPSPAPFEEIVGATISSGPALAALAQPVTTTGKGDQNSTESGFAVSPDKKFIFVGHNTSNQVECFQTKTDGTLVAAAGAPVTANQAGWIAVNPVLNVIYVTDTTPGGAASKVDIFGYDGTTGQLAIETPLAVADSVRGIAVDPLGRFLVTVHMFGAGTGVSIYALDARGMPQTTPTQSWAITAGRPKAATFDRTGTRLYVRNIDTGIYAYGVNAQGMLSPLNGGNAYPIGSYVAGLVASPSLDLLYVLEIFNSSGPVIHPFKVDAAGTLTALPTLPLGPGDDVQHFAIGRSGNYLFATSRSASHVRCFSIAPATGALTENTGATLAVTNPAGKTGEIVVDD